MAISDLVVAKFMVTREAVDDYRYATQDTNKLHEDIDLGMRMITILNHLARAYREQRDLKDPWTEQTADFKGAVGIGKEAVCTMQLVDNNKLEGKIYVPDESGVLIAPSVVATITYGIRGSLSHNPAGMHRTEFTLHQEAEAGVARSIQKTLPGIKFDGSHYNDLALGYVSPALISDGKRIVAAAQAMNKDPVYGRLTITALNDPIMCRKDQISIETNCDCCRDRKGNYFPTAVVRHNGIPLYEVKPILAFEERAKILAPLKSAS